MNNTLKIATIVSKIFEPALLIPIAFILCATRIGLSVQAAFLWMSILTGPMLAYRLWAKNAKGLDWDMHERKSRIKPFGYLLGYLCVTALILLVFEPLLLPLLWLFLVWTIGFFIITASWTKISGHVGGDMLAVGMILQWYGRIWWPLLFIIPLVAWARVVRKDHTVLQVILGAGYSSLIMYGYGVFI